MFKIAQALIVLLVSSPVFHDCLGSTAFYRDRIVYYVSIEGDLKTVESLLKHLQ